MGCAGSKQTGPAEIGYDTPMETVLHTTESICPPTIVSKVKPSNRVVRVVGRIEPGRRHLALRSYSSGAQSVLIDLELIVETNYMIAVERDPPELNFSESDEEHILLEETIAESLKSILEDTDNEEENSDIGDKMSIGKLELSSGSLQNKKVSTSDSPKAVAPEVKKSKPASNVSSTNKENGKPSPTSSSTPSLRPSLPPQSQSQPSLLSSHCKSTSSTESTPSISSPPPIPPKPNSLLQETPSLEHPQPSIHSNTVPSKINDSAPKNFQDPHVQNYSSDDEELSIEEGHLFEFIPGFDAWSEGLKERADFWLVQGGHRIYVPMKTKNYSILTDLQRDRKMYGDPILVGRKKRQQREKDYYLGCNKVLGGYLSKCGASRVDFEAAAWIMSSNNPKDFPTALKKKINKDFSDISDEYFSGASYGFREAKLKVGQTVHILGIVKEEFHQGKNGKRGKILVLHPFKANQLLTQQKEPNAEPGDTSLPVGSGREIEELGRRNKDNMSLRNGCKVKKIPNPILRNLLEEDFIDNDLRMVLSTKDDNGNHWDIRDFETTSRSGFPQKTNKIMGASKVNDDGNMTKILPFASDVSSKVTEKEEKMSTHKVEPVVPSIDSSVT
jgi:hypothetical protein